MGTITSHTGGGGTDAGLLLLYAAGELSADDRAAVDRAVAADPAAAAMAAEVAAAYAAAMAAVETADAADPIAPAVEAASLRRASRALRQWQVDRLTRPAADLAGGRRNGADPQWWRRLPSWTYAAAVAAVLVTGAVAWWGVATTDSAATGGGTTVAAADATSGTGTDENVSPGPDPANPVVTVDAARLERSFSSDAGAADAGISDAETQASALPANNDAAATSSVFFGAAD